MNYKVSILQSMHAVESLQLSGIVVLDMTMPYYYRQTCASRHSLS